MNKFFVSTHIYSGVNSLDVLQRFKDKRVWVVCDSFIAKSPAFTRLKELLEPANQVALYSDITPDPSIGIVVEGLRHFTEIKPDVVIGFGGGSAIDAAKAIVYFARQQGMDIETCVAIPTTSGTGSEVTSATVISDPGKGIKYPIFAESIYPDVAILDPSLVVTVPPHRLLQGRLPADPRQAAQRLGHGRHGLQPGRAGFEPRHRPPTGRAISRGPRSGQQPAAHPGDPVQRPS